MVEKDGLLEIGELTLEEGDDLLRLEDRLHVDADFVLEQAKEWILELSCDNLKKGRLTKSLYDPKSLS